MSQDNRTTPPAPAEPQEVTEATLQALATSCAKKRGPADTLWQFDDLGLSIFISKIRGLAAPPSQQPAQEQDTKDALHERVRDAIATALGDAFDCLRVWDAWQVGTMGPDDFSLITDDDDRLDEITNAAIDAMSAAQGDAAQGGGN